MNTIHLKCLGLVLMVAVLGGCAGGERFAGSDNVQNAATYPLPRQALADEVYLDGTGPTARRMVVTRDNGVETLQGSGPQPGGPTRAVVRSRPTAIPRNDDISASTTTGTRNSGQGDPNKPFSDEWRQKEQQEDARLRARMNICRGC